MISEKQKQRRIALGRILPELIPQLHALGPFVIRDGPRFGQYCEDIKKFTEFKDPLDLFDCTAALLAIATSQLEIIHALLPAADIFEKTGDMKEAQAEAIKQIDSVIEMLEHKDNEPIN